MLSIRSKLILSYMAMTVLPIVILLSIYFIYTYTLHHHHVYKKEGIEFVESKRIKVLGECVYTTQNDPDKLLNKQYQKNLDKKMNQITSGMIIQKSKHFIYSSQFLKQMESLKILNNIRNVSPALDDDDAEVKIGDYNYYLDVLKFKYKDGSPGTLYFFKYKDPVPLWTQPIAIIIAIFVLLAVSIILTYLVSRNIINPIRRLENAAGKIKEGDLNFVLSPGSKDEIGKLNRAFEEMRVRLKDSIDKGLLYEKNRKELISNISHDLRTPLTAIKGYVEGLMDGVPQSKEMQTKYLQTISKKAKDMDNLIEELFLLSKLDLKQVPFHLDRMDFCDYVRDCMEECRLSLKNNHITLETQIPDYPIYIKGDQEKLWRAIMNVIENAIKYMSLETPVNKRRLILNLEDNAESVVLRIQDSGPGIDKEEIPLLFDRFYRPEASRNSKTGGTGLGLSIVKEIIEAHNGEVQITSEKGIGTTVSIILSKDTHSDKERK